MRLHQCACQQRAKHVLESVWCQPHAAPGPLSCEKQSVASTSYYQPACPLARARRSVVPSAGKGFGAPKAPSSQPSAAAQTCSCGSKVVYRVSAVLLNPTLHPAARVRCPLPHMHERRAVHVRMHACMQEHTGSKQPWLPATRLDACTPNMLRGFTALSEWSCRLPPIRRTADRNAASRITAARPRPPAWRRRCARASARLCAARTSTSSTPSTRSTTASSMEWTSQVRGAEPGMRPG